MEGGGRTRVCDSRSGDLFFSGNVVGHLTAEEEEEQEAESALGCALRRLGLVFGSNAPPPDPLEFLPKSTCGSRDGADTLFPSNIRALLTPHPSFYRLIYRSNLSDAPGRDKASAEKNSLYFEMTQHKSGMTFVASWFVFYLAGRRHTIRTEPMKVITGRQL